MNIRNLVVERRVLQVFMIVDDDLEANDDVLLVLLVDELIDEREKIAREHEPLLVVDRGREIHERVRALQDLERLLAQLVNIRLAYELRLALAQQLHELEHGVLDQLIVRRERLH